MTAENVAEPVPADSEYQGGDHEPELKRTLGGFQVFAISFAFISVAVAVFATYDDLLNTAGPVGIWLFAVLGLILAGAVYFAYMLIFHREVLEQIQPG
jgi:amino acid transporter